MSIGNQMIDDMTKVIDQAKHDMWVGKAHQSGDFTNHSKNIATALYNANYRKQIEWISVEDRLPEEKSVDRLMFDRESLALIENGIVQSFGTNSILYHFCRKTTYRRCCPKERGCEDI